MFKSKHVVIALTALVVLLSACSGGDVSGTYKNEYRKSTLQLTKNGKLIAFDGVGEYSIEGSKIIITVPMMGGAAGTVEGSKLVFPKGRGEIAGSLEGIWVKQ